MTKLGKQAYLVFSAAVIIVGVILILVAGFGYTPAANGENVVSIVLDYGVTADDVDIKAIEADIEAVVGARATDVAVSVDSYTTFPAVTASFKYGTVIDGEGVLSMFGEKYPELEATAYSVYTAEPTFTGESVSGVFGVAFIAIVVMFLCVLAAKGIKSALWMLAYMIHNVLLVLAFIAIFRLGGGEYILAALMLTIFLTVYAAVRNVENQETSDCSLRSALPSIAIAAGSFLVFGVVALCLGAVGFFAYCVAMAVAAAVPFYTDSVFSRTL